MVLRRAEKAPRTNPPHYLVCYMQKGKGPSLGIPDNLGGQIFMVASACTIVGSDVSTTTRSTRHLASLDLRWATRPLVSLGKSCHLLGSDSPDPCVHLRVTQELPLGHSGRAVGPTDSSLPARTCTGERTSTSCPGGASADVLCLRNSWISPAVGNRDRFPFS